MKLLSLVESSPPPLLPRPRPRPRPPPLTTWETQTMENECFWCAVDFIMT